MYATVIERVLEKEEVPDFLRELAQIADKGHLVGLTLHCFIDIDPDSPTYGKMIAQGERKEMC